MKISNQDLSQIEENSAQAASFLKLLGNQQRLLILAHLTQGELSVGELESRLNISQSSLSQHLARLRSHGVVEFRKQRTTVYYALRDPKAVKILETLMSLY